MVLVFEYSPETATETEIYNMQRDHKKKMFSKHISWNNVQNKIVSAMNRPFLEFLENGGDHNASATKCSNKSNASLERISFYVKMDDAPKKTHDRSVLISARNMKDSAVFRGNTYVANIGVKRTERSRDVANTFGDRTITETEIQNVHQRSSGS